MKKQYRTFEEAKKFVKKLNLKTKDEWGIYVKSGKLPDNIPRSPDNTYKKQGTWKGWGDWLGTGVIANQYISYMLFEDAKKFVEKLKLKNREEWKKYCRSGQKPGDIPTAPNNTYNKQGTWTNWGDFLGTGYVANQNREYRSFEETREFVINLKLKNQKDWYDFSRSKKKPSDIPNYPNSFYKKQGTWTNWGDFLGTGNVANQNREYLSIIEAKIEARKIAKKLGIKNESEWSKAYREGKIPKNLPSSLWNQYGKKK
jgi:hypothetical protein